MAEHLIPLDELEACGLPTALEVMGERWSFMILRAAFNGVYHFEDFLGVLGIARNILSNRLVRLVDHGIMRREPCAHDRRKIEYRLTSRCASGARSTGSACRPIRCWSTSAITCRSRRSASTPTTVGRSAIPNCNGRTGRSSARPSRNAAARRNCRS